jgi:hypothetical protein
MSFILQPWQLLLTILAGLISRQQQEVVAKILDTIDPDWPLFDAARSCVPQALVVLRDRRCVRADLVAGMLARIGDPRSAKALLDEALRRRHAHLDGEAARGLIALGAPAAPALVAAAKGITDGRDLDGIAGVRRAIRLRNQELGRQLNRLVCVRCHLRASVSKGSLGRPWREKFVVCRGCGAATHLRGGVGTLVGVIGGDRRRYWHEDDGTARYAEIDRLLVAEGGAEDHDRALAAVVKTLTDGASRSPRRLRRVTVVILGRPALSDDSRLLLRETFQSVSEQG